MWDISDFIGAFIIDLLFIMCQINFVTKIVSLLPAVTIVYCTKEYESAISMLVAGTSLALLQKQHQGYAAASQAKQ